MLSSPGFKVAAELTCPGQASSHRLFQGTMAGSSLGAVKPAHSAWSMSPSPSSSLQGPPSGRDRAVTEGQVCLLDFFQLSEEKRNTEKEKKAPSLQK